MPTDATTRPVPTSLHIAKARDGGYVITTGLDALTDQRGRSVFAGDLGQCLGYMAASFLGQDPAMALGAVSESRGAVEARALGMDEEAVAHYGRHYPGGIGRAGVADANAWAINRMSV
jgi:hypothetical protein